MNSSLLVEKQPLLTRPIGRNMSMTSGESGARYLRVKRKIDEDPCFSSRQYKRCKYIASVKSNLIQDVLKVVNNQNISESDIIDVNQTRTGDEDEEDVITCNGMPLELEESSRDYVYDIYSLQDLDNNLYSVNEEDEGTDDSDSNAEDNPRNEYPDDEDYDYRVEDYYREWEDEEEYKLKEQFEGFGVKESDDAGSSSEDSLDSYDEAEEEDEDADDEVDPDDVEVPLASTKP